MDLAARNTKKAVLLKSVTVKDVILQSKHIIHNEWKAEWLQESSRNKLKEINNEIKPTLEVFKLEKSY